MMKSIKIITHVLLFVCVSLFLFNCKDKEKVKENEWYTCSMDPQIKEKQPGLCPLCKMEMTKTVITPDKKKEGLELSETQILLGNIQTAPASYDTTSEKNVLRGTLVTDERRINVIASRVPGRIERLYVKNPGERIKKGELIYDIYSEELQAAVKQYLLIKQKSESLKGTDVNYEVMLKAAKDKLIVWGLTNAQIKNISQGSLSHVVSFYSDVEGVAEEILVNEGDYVNEGSPVIKVADYSVLWAEAEAYSSDLTFFVPGKEVMLTVEDFPNEVVSGKVVFENPELEPGSAITTVHVSVANQNHKYKPGMRVTLSVPSKEMRALTVPESAVLSLPEMNVVWLRNKDGSFSHRMVKTGKTMNNKIEIKQGIKRGDQVVFNGAYLLNSEYLLRSGASISSMPGMDMSGTQETNEKNQDKGKDKKQNADKKDMQNMSGHIH